jgi:hypothetical protein
MSAQVRLERLWPKATYKADESQLQLPVVADNSVAVALVSALQELVPPAA